MFLSLLLNLSLSFEGRKKNVEKEEGEDKPFVMQFQVTTKIASC